MIAVAGNFVVELAVAGVVAAAVAAAAAVSDPAIRTVASADAAVSESMWAK